MEVSAESYFDIASRHGLIGCIKGTPPDLSTNPAYMEGFGQDERLVQLRAAVKVGLDELDRAQGQPWDKEEVWREVQRRLSERQQTFEDSHG